MRSAYFQAPKYANIGTMSARTCMRLNRRSLTKYAERHFLHMFDVESKQSKMCFHNGSDWWSRHSRSFMSSPAEGHSTCRRRRMATVLYA